MKQHWRANFIFIIAISSIWILTTSVSPFKQIIKVFFDKYLWVGPVLLFIAGLALLIFTVVFNRFIVRLNTTLLLPLFLLVCLGINIWRFNSINIIRLDSNDLIELFQQPRDAFENFPLYVLMSDYFKGKTLITDQTILKDLKMSPWEFQAYARLSKVEMKPYRNNLPSEELRQILKLPHIIVDVKVLGHKDGKWFVVPRKYVLITESLESNNPLGMAKNSDQVIIASFDKLIKKKVN